MVEEGRVHRLAHLGCATKREGQVGDAPARERRRKRPLDLCDGIDEGLPVTVVLGNPRGHREDVWIEDDVLGGEPHFLGQNPIGTRADRDLPLGRIGLSLLVERHHDDRSAVPEHFPCLLAEWAFSVLEGDRVDDAFPLQALKARLQNLPARRVHHHRNPGNVGLRREETEETDHRRFGVEEPLVHVHVEDLGAAVHLTAGDFERLLEPVLADERPEALGPGHVRALADVHEVQIGSDVEWLEAR